MSTGHKILVADDSLTIRKLVETVLTQDGYEVITAENAKDCLASAATHQPHLILLDYVLPDMQGTEVCRNLSNNAETSQIPVLMMSSNGNAIRQLYQDLSNVADYLTKPFAPNVLKAVVGHLLQKSKPADSADAGAVSLAGLAATAEGGAQKDLVDKVTRLIGLMEGAPAVVTGAESAKKTAPAVEKPASKPRRSRKPVASAPTPDAIARKFRRALQKHLRSRCAHIPEWEPARGTQDPEEFYLERVLPRNVLNELAMDLWRATGAPSDKRGAVRCPVSLVPLDTLINHLHMNRATGELHVDLEEETVLAFFEQGEIVLITTNHARNYCSGAAYDFGTVPHAVIGEAVRAQEEQSLPFFISLKSGGNLAEGASLEDLLCSQGTKALVRAFKSADAVTSFYPLSKLPAVVRACRFELSLQQLVLACYRTVDDWFTLEHAVPDMEAVISPTAEFETSFENLDLDPIEANVMEAVGTGHTVLEIAEATGLKPFEICRVLYRFIKLQMVRLGGRRVPADKDLKETSSALTPVAETSDEAIAGVNELPEFESKPESESVSGQENLDTGAESARLHQANAPITPTSPTSDLGSTPDCPLGGDPLITTEPEAPLPPCPTALASSESATVTTEPADQTV